MALSKHQSKKGQVLPTVQEGERVLTFHGPILREAECVRVAVEDGQVKYLVRYRSQGVMGLGGPSRGAEAYPSALPGPSSSSSSVCSGGPSTSRAAIPSISYTGPTGAGPSATASGSEQSGSIACCDYEWIPASRVLRYCSSSGKDSEGDDGSSWSTDSVQPDDSSPTSPRGCGQAADVGRVAAMGMGWEPVWCSPTQSPGPWGPEKKYVKRREVKVPLPDALKPLLVKDWELVNHGKKLFNLPAKKPVDVILAEYAVCQQSCGILSTRYAVHELVDGIREYFNVMLGTQLLYQFERPQHAQLLVSHPNVPMSQIYGGAHLLRLFVQIGSELAYSALDDSSLSLLLGHMQDFLKYLACNPSVLFTEADYQVAPAEYQQRAE